MSLFVLTGLAILIVRRETLGTGSLRHAALLSAAAGLIAGSAVGLKLPEAPYALGFAAALMALPGDLKRRGVRLLAGGVAGVAGVALFSGYWFCHGSTRSPAIRCFPISTNCSIRRWRSPPPIATCASCRMIWLHALLDPILFSIDWRVANDLPFTDIRVGVAYVAADRDGGDVAPTQAHAQSPDRSPDRARRHARALRVRRRHLCRLAQRLRHLPLHPDAGDAGAARDRGRRGALAARRARCVSSCWAGSPLPCWSRRAPISCERAPLGDPYVQVKMPAIAHPNDTMILMAGEAPMGYLVPSFPQQIPVLRIDGWLMQPRDGSRLTAKTRARVDAFTGRSLSRWPILTKSTGHAPRWPPMALPSGPTSAEISKPIWAGPTASARSSGSRKPHHERLSRPAGRSCAAKAPAPRRRSPSSSPATTKKPPSPAWCAISSTALPDGDGLRLRQQFEGRDMPRARKAGGRRRAQRNTPGQGQCRAPHVRRYRGRHLCTGGRRRHL